MQQESSQKSFFSTIYPWLAIFLSAAFLFYKYILQVYPSIMTNQLMRAFHVYGTGLGNLAATFFYSYLITQLFVGYLLDRYSVRLLSSVAILISAIGAYFFAHAHTLLEAQLSRAMMGFGAAFATVSYMKVAAVWFKPNQFAFVGGLLATAAMLGAIFGEAPLSLVVAANGWRQSLILCSIVGLVIAVLFFIVIRDRIRKPSQSTMPTAPYRISVKDVWGVLSKRQNWILTFYSGLAFSPVAVFGGLWGNPFLMEAHHLSETNSATLISLVFIGLAVGGPALGLLSDYFRRRRPVMFAGSLLSLICISLVIYSNTLYLWEISILLFFFGFGTGSFMLGFAVGKEINKVALAATVIALINTGDAIFGAITEPMVGHFLDVGWAGKIIKGVHYFSLHDYHAAFLVLPLYLLIATGLVFFVRETKAQNEPEHTSVDKDASIQEQTL